MFVEKEKQNNNKQTKKNEGKNKQIKNGNNSSSHEPLSEEWIGRRSWILNQIISNPSIPDFFICDTSTTWIVSPINKPYIYVGNRVGLDYFLNIPSNRLDWMHPQHPWLEKYLTVNFTQRRNPQMKFQVWNPQTRSRLKILFRNDRSCLP